MVGALLPVPLPVKVATLYGGAVLGAEGRRKIVPNLDSAALLELAMVFDASGDFTQVPPVRISEVQRKYKLPDEAFADIKIEM